MPEFLSKMNLEPNCEICHGPHKTSQHGIADIREDNKINLITKEDKDSYLNINKIIIFTCDICGKEHKTSDHPIDRLEKFR